MRNAGPPLTTRILRDLELACTTDGTPAFLYAASGLVCSGGELHVIADDEVQLARFAASGNAPGTLIPLLAGRLPDEPEARKREKPDFEILLKLPALQRYPSGALLALGSGSRTSRERGALLALDVHGRIQGEAAKVDAAPLFGRLSSVIGALNLEGAWLHGSRLRLLQRGHQGGGGNFVLDLDFGVLSAALAHEQVLIDAEPERVQVMTLGDLEGVTLTFTDACGFPDGSWLFSAVAEDTDDSYADGVFVGSTLGLVTADGQLAWQRMLSPGGKVEGIHGEVSDAGLRILCVTDADERRMPSQLVEARISAQSHRS